MGRLLDRLVADALSVCVAGLRVEQPDVELTTPFRHLDRPPELVRVRPPGGRSRGDRRRAARGPCTTACRGPRWRCSCADRRAAPRAIAVRSPATAYPSRPVPGLVTEEPVVRAIIDMLRWANGDAQALDRLLGLPARRSRRHDRARRPAPGAHGDGGLDLEAQPELRALVGLRDDLAARADRDDPAALAYEVWRRALDPRGLARRHGQPGRRPRARRDRGLPRRPDSATPNAIPATGCRSTSPCSTAPVLEADPWRVVGGAAARRGDDHVDRRRRRARVGHRRRRGRASRASSPRSTGAIAFFDRARLEGADVPSVAERRRRSLDRRATALRGGGVHAGHAPAGRDRGTRARRAAQPVRRRVAGAPTRPARSPGPPAPRPAADRGDATHSTPTASCASPPAGSTPTTTARCATPTSTSSTCAARPGCRPRWARVFHEVLAEFLDPGADRAAHPRGADGARPGAVARRHRALPAAGRGGPARLLRDARHVVGGGGQR